MSEAEHELTDFDDRPILVGTRVRLWNADLDVPADVDGVVGTVTSLGEWDGDVDDYGRPTAIYPLLTVRFDDGTAESFTTCEWQQSWYGETPRGKVEELDVIA